MPGIFKILYKLQLRSSNDPLEDYLTEIFCFLLQNNPKILSDFLEHFKIKSVNPNEGFSLLTTQHGFNKLEDHHSGSRPDIVLLYKNTSIFFENKINSKEGYQQLKRYAEHLDKARCNEKCLVYLTKNYEEKIRSKIFKNCNSTINFVQIRWFQIFHFLKKYRNNPLVLELLKFLKEIQLSMNNQFTPADIIALSNFSKVQNLLDETMFGNILKTFKKINGKTSQPSSCMTQLRRHDRYIYTSDQNYKVWTGLGYWMNSNNEKEYPEVGVVIEVAPKSEKRNEVIQALRSACEANSRWESYSLENDNAWAGIFVRESLQTFLASSNQILEIQKFLKISLEELESIYTQFPILRKPSV